MPRVCVKPQSAVTALITFSMLTATGLISWGSPPLLPPRPVAMPNIGLSDVDIQDLFAYFEEENRSVEHKHRGDDHQHHHH